MKISMYEHVHVGIPRELPFDFVGENFIGIIYFLSVLNPTNYSFSN